MPVYERSTAEEYRLIRCTTCGYWEPKIHLRYMCIHMLQHGAYRALWLCDIAVVLESLPEDFDWEYLLRGDRRPADWVASTVGLANQLLGARLDGIPVAERTRHLP